MRWHIQRAQLTAHPFPSALYLGVSGQSSAGSDIGQTGTRSKPYDLGYSHGMEYVMLVQIVNILA